MKRSTPEWAMYMTRATGLPPSSRAPATSRPEARQSDVSVAYQARSWPGLSLRPSRPASINALTSTSSPPLAKSDNDSDTAGSRVMTTVYTARRLVSSAVTVMVRVLAPSLSARTPSATAAPSRAMLTLAPGSAAAALTVVSSTSWATVAV